MHLLTAFGASFKWPFEVPLHWHQFSAPEIAPWLSGSVPFSLKLATITVILKKSGINPGVPKNYSPIPNLPFQPKLPECAVATQLKAHLSASNLS